MLRHRLTRSAALLAAAALTVTVSACTPAQDAGPTSSPPSLPAFTTTTTSTSPSPAAAPADYQRLLLTAGDLTDNEDTFLERSRQPQPDGATAFFVNEKDNRAISDTVTVYPDVTAARGALRDATQKIPTAVVGGQPRPIPVGIDGVMAVGSAPDGDKAITLVYFAEGPAVARLEFQSAPQDATTDMFVTTVAKMQQIALRTGLNRPE